MRTPLDSIVSEFEIQEQADSYQTLVPRARASH